MKSAINATLTDNNNTRGGIDLEPTPVTSPGGGVGGHHWLLTIAATPFWMPSPESRDLSTSSTSTIQFKRIFFFWHFKIISIPRIPCDASRFFGMLGSAEILVVCHLTAIINPADDKEGRILYKYYNSSFYACT